MIVTFYSNYLTHHQIPFCNAMFAMDGVEFKFVSTETMDEERSNGGWKLKESYPYELRAFESKEDELQAEKLSLMSDVIIIGSAPEKYVELRMRKAPQKLTIRYSERIYKRGRWRVLSPRGALNRFKTFFRYMNKPLYMLCASSYTAGDLAMLGSYIGRCYKWGYFPQVKRYIDLEKIIGWKHPACILWAGRLIGWKHPEMVLEVAERLENEGLNYNITILGDGPLRESLQTEISNRNLHIDMIGTVPSEEVREYMEKSQIFLFTSDQNEGWGAVLNESMNSACAVVASNAVGATGFLIKNGYNGLTFKSENIDDLYDKVKLLLLNKDKADALGMAAYRTITELWCADVAAERLVEISKNLLEGKKIFFKDGPCSKAHIISR